MSETREPPERSPPADTLLRSARFRPGGEGAPPPPAAATPPALRFSQAAEALGGDHDVLLGYQLFLGRDPESSFVISEARTNPVHGFMRGLLTSDEFTHAVLLPLEAGRPVPHERGSTGPDAEHIAWLLRHLQIDETAAARLAEAADWRGLLTELVGLPGFPRVKSATSVGVAEPSAPGFVLITIEQPRAGETLAGGRVEGSGWVIAPSDVADVSVLLGEQLLTQARSGLPRPDVARRFPHYRDAVRSGFAFSADVPAMLAAAGADELTILVRTTGGEQGRRSVRIRPPGGDAKRANGRPKRLATPVGLEEQSALQVRIDRPVPSGDATRVPAGQALALSGWAVAQDGVASVTVHLDETAVGEAHRGARREDIAAAFEGFEGALLSGWALVIPRQAVTPGSHRLRVVVTDVAGTTADTSMSLWVDADAGETSLGRPRMSMPAPEIAFAKRLLAAQKRQPFFTVLIRSGAAGAALETTLESLERQVVAGWRAVVEGPNEMGPGAVRLGGRVQFAAVAALDAAVRERPPEGAASLVCALRAGDVLGCDALLEFAVAAAVSPDAEFIYADERRDGQALYKPDFAPEQLLGMNYVGRAWCAAADLVERTGGLAGATDYDAVLRLSEAARRVVHAPRLLLERGGAADTVGEEAAALAAAADRRGFKAEIYSGPTAGVWHVRRVAQAGQTPSVSIIIPTAGASELVRQAITSIRASAGTAVEIVVVDDLPPRSRGLRAWLRKQADVVVRAEGSFNWSRFSNQGARAASGDMLLFLNDDIDAPSRGWLQAMLEQATRPEVGVVGAKLVYPAGRLQHAGLYLDGAVGRHAFRFHDADEVGPFGLASVTREMIGVTGACLMTRREVFESLGGFDEAHGIINNDLDFCLRARTEGLDVIYTPHARLVHHELASRAGIPDSFDVARFADRFRSVLPLGDPFRNANLAADDDQYAPDQEPVAFLYAGKAGRPRSEVRSILLVKLDHIGDFVAALPAMQALKAQFPAARLSLLAPPATVALATIAPMVDEVIAFTFFESRSSEGRSDVGEKALDALEAMLAPRRFDIAIDLRMHPETRSVLRRTGAGFLAGYDHEGRFPWLDVALEWEGDTRLLLKRSHIAERLLQLAHATAAAFAPEMPVVAMPSLGMLAAGAGLVQPKEAVLAMLPAAFAGRRLACVHPGVGNPIRQWPAASFAALIDMLVADGMAVVLVGSAEESEVADAVLRHIAPGAPVCSLAGSLALGQLPALLQACALFVGNDSGPKHLAASLGVPTVGVHSGVVDAREWGPVGHAAIAVQKQMVCGPCYIAFAEECPRAFACLTGVRPRHVYAACQRVMAAGPAPARDGAGPEAEQIPAPAHARREMPSLLGAGPLAEASLLAAGPLQPEGKPQGYVETVASDGSGVVWVVGWMRKGHPLEFPAAVLGRGQHAAGVGLMTYPRPDLSADAHGVIGIIAGTWKPAEGEDGALEAFTLFFGEGGRFHLRCHAPLRRLSIEALAQEYQDLLERGRAMRQAPSLQRLLGALEVWEPTRPGPAWFGLEASIDRILLVPGLGCFVEGWILSPLRRIETLRLRAGGVVMTLMPQTLEWKRRQDLASAYPASAAMAARAGFVGLFEGAEEPADFADAVLKLVFEGGASVNWAIPQKVFRRLGQSARLEEARAFFPALEEEAFFPRFAAAAVRAEKALAAAPLPIQVEAAARVLVFVLPHERCDRFLLFEEVARQCRSDARAAFDGVAFVGTTGIGRSDALWMFREFVRDVPGVAGSLMMIGEPSQALALLPEILAAIGARRFLFVADGVFLTAAGWEAIPRVLGDRTGAMGGDGGPVCLTSPGMIPGARCFGWSAGAFAAWSRDAVTFLGGLFGDNGLGALSPAVVPGAVRVSRAVTASHLQDAVNRVLAGPSA